MCSKQFFISRINLQTFIMDTDQSIMAVSYLKKTCYGRILYHTSYIHNDSPLCRSSWIHTLTCVGACIPSLNARNGELAVKVGDVIFGAVRQINPI